MTQESTENLPQVVDAEVVESENKELSFEDKARALLPLSDYEDMDNYIKDGKPELALVTANKFFQLFLNGTDVDDICRLNPAFPRSAINWCRIKYDWDRMLKEHIFKLQQNIAEKVLKAQLEATSLYADIITAANKKHSDSLKKYIQTGDKAYLEGTLDIKSIHQLQKAVEGLQKVTNQDKNLKVTEEKNVNINLTSDGGKDMDPETATKILSALAEANRKKELQKKG